MLEVVDVVDAEQHQVERVVGSADVAVGSTDLADVIGTITNAYRAATYALGPRHPAASLLECTGPHHRLHVRVADPEQLLNAAAARCNEGLVLAIDHELWQIGPGLPRRLDASDEHRFDNADVHLSRPAFVRLALGLEHVATVAGYDADVEFRTASARDHLTRLSPHRTRPPLDRRLSRDPAPRVSARKQPALPHA